MTFRYSNIIRHSAVGVLALFALGACTIYHPDPVDFARDSAEWQQLSERLCPPGHALSVKELHSLGLLLNPDLNKARETYAHSTKVAEFAGLWNDPSLSAEAKHVLQANFYNKNLGLSLTLPVTGLPSLSRKVAERYAETDFWDMRAQERDFLRKLDILRNEIMILHERHNLMRQRLKVVQQEMADIDKLHAMGEISFSEYQVACQRLIDTRKEEQETDKLHLEKHLELAALVGIHPACRQFELEGALPAGIPEALPVPTADSLLAAPELKALQAGYGATEAELRLEIRRQYPELNLSPSLSSEEGNRQLGLGIGFDIPLWNRNREAIARAGKDRAVKKCELIAKWRSLQQDASGLGDRQETAIRHCRTEFEDLRRLEETAQREEKLHSMGESSLPQLAEARHELYQRRLSYLECLSSLLEIRTSLYYLNPNN